MDSLLFFQIFIGISILAAALSYGIMIYRSWIINKYKKMSQKYPHFLDIRLKTAKILEDYGIFDEAEAEYLEVIKIFPRYLDARIRLSDLYLQMGKKNLARVQLEEVLRLSDQSQKYYHKALERLYELD